MQCSRGRECATFHDVVQNVFASIAKDAQFHVYHE
jgi:hypothetical protein